MEWVYLLLGGLLEVVWAFGLKYSEGFTELWPSVVTVVSITASMILFAKAMRTIPTGTAYAIFTGIGSAGTVIVGMVFLGEWVSFWKIFFVLVLITGIIGLKITSPDEPSNPSTEQTN